MHIALVPREDAGCESGYGASFLLVLVHFQRQVLCMTLLMYPE